MNRKFLIALSALSLMSGICACGHSNNQKDNYGIEEITNENASAYYEVFVGEYADSNKDGIGDLSGLKAKLPYLKKLGVGGVWLMPIMPSHSYHKYNVDDFYSIDEKYGTLEDFDAMIKEANNNNIDVIIDLVLNHTSTYNSWFIESEKDYKNNNTSADSKKDWYSWSEKGGTGYTKSNVANAYYESNFDSSMPELNLDCPQVREEIKKVVKFWLDRGVKGFRLDAITYYYYGAETQNVEFLKWLNETCKEIKEDVYIVGEAYTTSRPTLMTYASSGISVFNFAQSENTLNGFAWNANHGDAKTLANYNLKYDAYLKEASPSTMNAPFLSNHDMDRSSGYLKGDKSKLAASLYLLTKGHPFIYYGEEIGLKGKRPVNSSTDADRRLAMIWSETNDEYRCNDPIGATYNSKVENEQVKLGAMDNIDQKDTLTYHYRKVLSIRNKYSDFIQKGTYENLSTDSILQYKITYNNETIYMITNLSEEQANIEVPIETSINDEIRIMDKAAKLKNNSLTLGGYNTVIIS